MFASCIYILCYCHDVFTGTCKCNTIKTDRVMSPCSAAQVPVPTEYWRARSYAGGHLSTLPVPILYHPLLPPQWPPHCIDQLTIHLISTISWENGEKDVYGMVDVDIQVQTESKYYIWSKAYIDPPVMSHCQEFIVLVPGSSPVIIMSLTL